MISGKLKKMNRNKAWVANQKVLPRTLRDEPERLLEIFDPRDGGHVGFFLKMPMIKGNWKKLTITTGDDSKELYLRKI